MHTVSSKLFKAPFVKDGCGQDGQSKMYVIEMSEVIKDYKTQDKARSNYKAMFFAKSDAAKSYYDKAFAEGSFVVVSSEKLKVEVSDCGKYTKLMMVDAKLENAMINDQVNTGQQSPRQPKQQRQAPQQIPTQHQQQYAPQQQGGRGQQAPQQQQHQYNEPPMDFDDDIPF